MNNILSKSCHRERYLAVQAGSNICWGNKRGKIVETNEQTHLKEIELYMIL